jgi:ribosome-binding ATPase YchF (GTP1/OBG family)
MLFRFEDFSIGQYIENVDPVRDAEILNEELMMKVSLCICI